MTPEPSDGPTVARLRLGTRLRALRAAAGITRLAQAADAIGGSTAKVSRVENGLLPVRQEDVAALLRLYGASGVADLEELLALARESTRPGWWDGYSEQELPAYLRHPLELEAAASIIAVYDCLAVPALLQTGDYARAIASADLARPGWRGGLGPRVLARRRELISRPHPPRVWALVDEAAVHRAPEAHPAVMGRQLAHLIDMAARPHITVQVVPVASPGPLAAPGPFTLLRFPGPDLADVVFLELLTKITTLTLSRDVDRHWKGFNLLAVGALDPGSSVATLRALRAQW
jgi:transcriptional regulator with XRE-family HTH domain